MNTARITGIGYLIIFITGIYANFFVLESILVDGDAATTTAQLQAQFSQFRWGFLAFAVMVLVDILLAFPLYKLLKPVGKRTSLISSALRGVNGLVFLLALYSLLEVWRLHSGTGIGEASSLSEQTLHHFTRFGDIWLIGLIFFGLHLWFLGRLIVRSGYLPKVIGILLQVAALGYLVDSTARFLLPGYEQYQAAFEMASLLPGVIGELSLTLWLLIKAPQVPARKSSSLSTSHA